MADPTDVPVLVVGAGPAGLALALDLGRFGIRSAILERRMRPSLPGPRGLNARTMEVLRTLGAEAAMRTASIAPDRATDAIWAPTLSAPAIRTTQYETFGPKSGEPLSPSPGVNTSQDVVERILAEALERQGMSRIVAGRELTSCRPSNDEVEATWLDRTTGEAGTSRARFLIGADGARSTVREQASIAMEGGTGFNRWMSVLFRADLRGPLAGRSLKMAFLLARGAPTLLLNVDDAGTWTAMLPYDPAHDQQPADFTPERCRKIIREVVGDPDLELEIAHIGSWVSAARIAERFGVGRIFLVGDAAHEMPPAGGFGLNTAIQSAHNVAWKLAAVLAGWATERLLDTYEAERKPIARWIIDESLRNLAALTRIDTVGSSGPGQAAVMGAGAAGAGASAEKQTKLGRAETFREHGLVFGGCYESAAVIPDGTRPPSVENPVSDYVPSATPGSRLPHCWLQADGRRISTLDLVGPGFTLLAASAGAAWRDAGTRVASELGIPIRAVLAADAGWDELAGTGASGALLVRPDGHVAWRARDWAGGDPAAMLADALRTVLRR